MIKFKLLALIVALNAQLGYCAEKTNKQTTDIQQALKETSVQPLSIDGIYNIISQYAYMTPKELNKDLLEELQKNIEEINYVRILTLINYGATNLDEALILAVNTNNIPAIVILLAKNANPNAVINGKTSLEYVTQNLTQNIQINRNLYTIVTLLLEAGAAEKQALELWHNAGQIGSQKNVTRNVKENARFCIKAVCDYKKHKQRLEMVINDVLYSPKEINKIVTDYIY